MTAKANRFWIKLKGQDKPISVIADRVDGESVGLVLMIGNDVVAQFDYDDYSSWWPDPENTVPMPERLD